MLTSLLTYQVLKSNTSFKTRIEETIKELDVLYEKCKVHMSDNKIRTMFYEDKEQLFTNRYPITSFDTCNAVEEKYFNIYDGIRQLYGNYMVEVIKKGFKGHSMKKKKQITNEYKDCLLRLRVKSMSYVCHELSKF